jgi:hypothetical protein
MKINSFFKLKINSIQQGEHNLAQKIKFFVLSYFFALASMFILLLFVTMPMDFFIMKVLHYESMQKILDPLKKSNVHYPLYLVVFIGPFFEEILFRLGLIINKRNISIFIGVFIFEILGGSITTFSLTNSSSINLAMIGLASMLLSYFYLPKKVLDFLNNNKYYLIRFSILFFGLLHLTNASEFHWQLALFYPFFVLPQIVMGYFITNLRLKYGFFWGLSLHIVFNAISYL